MLKAKLVSLEEERRKEEKLLVILGC